MAHDESLGEQPCSKAVKNGMHTNRICERFYVNAVQRSAQIFITRIYEAFILSLHQLAVLCFLRFNT